MRIFTRYRLVLLIAIAIAGGGLALAARLSAQRGQAPMAVAEATSASFTWGSPGSGSGGASGCGVNTGLAAATAVSETNNVVVAAQRGAGAEAGVDSWTGAEQPGGGKADSCSLHWAGAVGGLGDVPPSAVWAPLKNDAGTYSLYLAGGAQAAPMVARSTDNGSTFAVVRLAGRLAPGQRPWIAAQGAGTVLVSYRDQASGRLSVQRSDDAGASFVEAGPLLPTADGRSSLAELGALVIDHHVQPSAGQGFAAYQAVIAPPAPTDRATNHPFLAVTRDGARTWSLRRIACAGSGRVPAHEVPALSLAPDGSIWYAWTDGLAVHTAVSRNQGVGWSCFDVPAAGLKGVAQPVLAATTAGVDLVYYGSQSRGMWSLQFAQTTPARAGWLAPQELMAAHEGSAESLLPASLAVDRLGWVHLAFAADGAELEPPAAQVLYAVQSGGSAAGTPN